MQLWHQLKATAHPWKVAKGPASAAICYMLELGWKPSSASAWVVRDEVVNLATAQGMGRLLQLLHVEVNLKRWAKIVVAPQVLWCTLLAMSLTWGRSGPVLSVVEPLAWQ